MEDKNQRKMLQRNTFLYTYILSLIIYIQTVAIDMNFELGEKIMKRKTNIDSVNYILDFQKEPRKRVLASFNKKSSKLIHM